MIYKKNPQTGKIHEFIDINALSIENSQWADPTQEEIEEEFTKQEAETLKQAKIKKAYQLYSNYTLKPVVWNFTWQDKTYSFTIDGVENASIGVLQAKTRLEKIGDIVTLINNGGFADIPLEYKNDEFGYKSIYIDVFSNFLIDRIVFKVDTQQDADTILDMYNLHIESISPSYDSSNLSEFQRFMIDYYAKRDELFALTTINEVNNFDISVQPIELEIPEDLIENVTFCNL